MSIKAKLEAIIYAAEEPVTLDQIVVLVKETVAQEIAADRARQSAAAEPAPDAEMNLDGEASPAEPSPAAESNQAAPPTPSAESGNESGENHTPEQTAESATDEATAEISAPPEAATSEDVAAPLDSPEPIETVSSDSAQVVADVAESDTHDFTASVPPSPTDAEIKACVREALAALVADYASAERGMEIRQVAGGYRMATKPEHHDLVRSFAKNLKPPIKLSLAALETLAVIAYKQPVTAPEITEIRGVDAAGVVGTLLQRKLITTAGRKAVIGRPMLYKTTKEFLLRFGLKDVNELPSIEEFERLAQEALGPDLFSEPSSPSPAQEPEEPAASATASDTAPDAFAGPEAETPVAEVASESEAASEVADVNVDSDTEHNQA
jgi:segregation and condensation protein B